MILHQHFKTPQKGGAIRSYYLAKALVDQGMEVEVITAHNDSFKSEVLEGITIHYLKVPYDNSYGFAKRALSFAGFVWKAVRKSKDIRGVTLCYAISVPLTVGVAAMWIKRRHNIPFIFEVGDLWPDAPIQMGFVNNYFLQKSLFALEKKIYKLSQAIVALSAPIKSAIESKVKGKKVYLIPNMADTDFFVKATKSSALVTRYNVHNKFVISYIGAIGEANGLDYLIECANASRKAGLNIHFLLCGDGAHRHRFSALIKKMELQNISMLDFTNRDGVSEIMNVTDAAFICYKPVPILETGSPNKFFDALAAGKAVIINFDGWIRKELETNRCGIYVDPYRPVDFIRKIKPLLEDKILLENYQYNARTLAEKNYSRKLLGEKFLDVINESAQAPRV